MASGSAVHHSRALEGPADLILEATSDPDAETERQIQAALEAATKGRTTFVIAHRLATIRGADRILVFDRGRIVEQGRFEDLIGQNGRFAALVRAQSLESGSAPGRCEARGRVPLDRPGGVGRSRREFFKDQEMAGPGVAQSGRVFSAKSRPRRPSKMRRPPRFARTVLTDSLRNPCWSISGRRGAARASN